MKSKDYGVEQRVFLSSYTVWSDVLVKSYLLGGANLGNTTAERTSSPSLNKKWNIL